MPQDDLVHPQLTIRQELDSAAALRLPPDLGKQGRNARVERVIDELGLAQRANLRIENLSGGQRKRASLAIELLTEPALLFLDEPTSGLDPGNEHQVMSVLRELADRGRIVIVVTHATQSLSLVDRVLFLTRGGHVAYYGPPDQALAYFARHGVAGGYAEIFRLLEAPEVDDLAARFRADADHDRYVDRALRQADVALWVTHGGRERAVSPVTPAAPARGPGPPPAPDTARGQAHLGSSRSAGASFRSDHRLLVPRPHHVHDARTASRPSCCGFSWCPQLGWVLRTPFARS